MVPRIPRKVLLIGRAPFPKLSQIAEPYLQLGVHLKLEYLQGINLLELQKTITSA